MAKVTGFDKSYSGLKENEAWQRIYEFGKNLMPIKERDLQKKYNKIFNKKTKVIRDNAINKVNTERLVPGDIIILEKGDFIPVDGRVIEDISLEFDKGFMLKDDNFNLDGQDKIVYQGMRVKKGKAIIEAIHTGDATYLGSIIKNADKGNVFNSNSEKVIHKYLNIIGLIGVALLIFGSVFSFINSEGEIINKLSVALYSGMLLFIAVIPIGPILVLGMKLFEQRRITKKSNLIIKKHSALLRAHKTTVICLDERFLKRDYEEYIQRFYSAGIMLAIISENSEDEVKDLAEKAGVFENDVNSISGNELDDMEDEEFYKTICNTIIFYEVNNNQRLKIAEGFNRLNIKTIGIVDEISDLPTLNYIDVGICTHHRKKNLEYEFSDATIIGDDLTSIYSLIKGSCIIKNYLNHYLKYYIIFQLPIIVSLLALLVAKISLKAFYIQTLALIMAIIPLLLLLVNKDYSEDMLIELKKEDKKLIINCVKFGFAGVAISILNIGLFYILKYFGISDDMKVNSVIVMMGIINAIIVIMSRRKFGISKEKNINHMAGKEKTKRGNVAESLEIVETTRNKVTKLKEKDILDKDADKKGEKIEETIVNEKDSSKYNHVKKEKQKRKRKSNIEDIRDKLM